MKKFLLALVVFCSFLMFACGGGTKYELKVNKDAYEIKVGESVELDVTFTEGAPVAWSSSDPSVVSVLDGVATAAKEGTAKITVKIKETELKGEITITVLKNEVAPESVVIAGETEVEEGKTLTFTAAVNPADAKQEVEWATSDATLATIDANGVLTALQAGTVKVIATAKGTDVKAEVEVTIKKVYDYSKLLVAPAFEGTEVEVNGVKYYVGETAFTSMVEAVAKVTEGGQIYVAAGTYAITEMIKVEKALTILGPNADKASTEERAEEANFTSDNYDTGSFLVSGANVVFNGLGFTGIGEQGYPIQLGEVMENLTIKSCYFDNVNTVVCPYASTSFKGTLVIDNTVNKNNLQFLAWVSGSAAELTKFEYTNNKVYGDVASHYAGKGMVSFRTDDSNAEIIIENNEFDLAGYVLASNPIYVASGKLTVKNNKFNGLTEETLFYDGTVAAKTLENNKYYNTKKLLVAPTLEGTEVEVNGVTYLVGLTAFTSMVEAVAKAPAGGEIYVAAGTYEITEMIVVEKALTILGPNANKASSEERAEEAMFTSDNYDTGSFLVSGADVVFNGVGFLGVGEQGYPIQFGAELENFAIKSCYFENVNTVMCPFSSTTFKGTLVIDNTVNKNSLQFLAWVAGSAAELTKFEYTNNKVFGEVADHFAGKGMISFRADDSQTEIIIENNDFDLSKYQQMDSNPIYVASGKLTVKNNKFTGIAEANLFVDGTVADKTLEGNQFN